MPRFDFEHVSNIMVVVEAEGQRVALLVDELLGQQQVVVKNLEANYRKVPDVSGATIDLVGVRALSEHYFNLYPPDLQELRCKFKPGLVPPFYADMPVTFEEIVE